MPNQAGKRHLPPSNEMTTAPSAPFNLLRWFAWLSPLIIGLIVMGNAWLISSFLNNQLFQREALISRDFVQNILVSDGSVAYFKKQSDSEVELRFRNSISHLSNMRDVLRANVFAVDGKVLWSTDARLIGKSFPGNDELDDAMRGELVVHAGQISSESRSKSEHVGLQNSADYFVETYIPVISPDSGDVVGVVELYKAPLALTKAIKDGRLQLGISALCSALALYIGLFWLIRRADSTIKRQHAQLLDSETMAVIGELTSSVAHNIRNPLSSIRSSAELILEMPSENCSEQARDIVQEVDRVSNRISELLRLTDQRQPDIEAVSLADILETCIAENQAIFERRGQTLSFRNMTEESLTKADPVLLKQVFYSLLSNASEAMAAGGQSEARLEQADKRRLKVSILDSGAGVSPDLLGNVFRPFFTTKPKGLGLGLPLARRIIERFGGTIQIHSESGRGTAVTIYLPHA